MLQLPRYGMTAAELAQRAPMQAEMDAMTAFYKAPVNLDREGRRIPDSTVRSLGARPPPPHRQCLAPTDECRRGARAPRA